MYLSMRSRVERKWSATNTRLREGRFEIFEVDPLPFTGLSPGIMPIGVNHSSNKHTPK